MKLGHELDEIRFAGMTEDGRTAQYQVALEGRPVMLILCEENDPEHQIRIAKPDGTAVQVTKGVFAWYDALVEDADGNPVGTVRQVNYKSVYAYVIPRLHILIARLLTPLT